MCNFAAKFTKMKRFLTIIAILLVVLNVHAVLKEKDWHKHYRFCALS